MVSFFTPLNFEQLPHRTVRQKILEQVDHFFYLGGRVAIVLDKPILEGRLPIKLKEGEVWEAKDLMRVALKMIALATLILPAIFLIVKAYLRQSYQFYLYQEKRETLPIIVPKVSIKPEIAPPKKESIKPEIPTPIKPKPVVVIQNLAIPLAQQIKEHLLELKRLLEELQTRSFTIADIKNFLRLTLEMKQPTEELRENIKKFPHYKVFIDPLKVYLQNLKRAEEAARGGLARFEGGWMALSLANKVPQKIKLAAINEILTEIKSGIKLMDDIIKI